MMIAALALALAAPVGLDSVAEYFPLNPGDEWEYIHESSAITATTKDTVGEPTEIDGKTVVPIITRQNGKEYDRAYYRVLEGEVQLVAFEKDKPLLSPYPILQSPEKSGKWTFNGETYVQGALSDLKMEGKVKKLSSVEFNGKTVEGLEVTLESTVLEQFGTKITTTQVATYGKGIGLVLLESTTKLPKRTEKSVRRLISYKPKKT